MCSVIPFLVHIGEDLPDAVLWQLAASANTQKQMEKFEGVSMTVAQNIFAPDLRHNMFICGSSKVPQLRVTRGIS
jgi:uncharacterized protein YecE (DUF72 family)